MPHLMNEGIFRHGKTRLYLARPRHYTENPFTTLTTNIAPYLTMSATSRSITDWSFTQIGGGEGTKDGEWLQVSSFPTTVHVELLKMKRIPDPVRLLPLTLYDFMMT